ncbi:unnamed protein product, partial [Callosobruchus maculatus]
DAIKFGCFFPIWSSKDVLILNVAVQCRHVNSVPIAEVSECVDRCLLNLLIMVVAKLHFVHLNILLVTDAIKFGCFCTIWSSNDFLLLNVAVQSRHLCSVTIAVVSECVDRCFFK